MTQKYNFEEVANIINSEGLGYAIQNYTSHNSIEDEKLAELWKVASEAMSKIEELLTEKLGDDWQE